MKELMLGNAALARGAYDAGCRVVSSYPGTPSTEITQFCAKHEGFYAEWAANEKVALEVAIGTAVGGKRALCCMKHVGLNVAADPLFTSAYTGVNAGLVIVVADDPGMHSSQNEQDSRYYARSAHVPMLEPADSQEAYHFIRMAFELSETYDTPVLVRMVTRIAHGAGLVETDPEAAGPVAPVTRPYAKDIAKYVMMPGPARARHVVVEARMKKMAADALPLHRCVAISGEAQTDCNPAQKYPLGIVAAGTAYQYVREAVRQQNATMPVAILKPGLVHPLPLAAIADFAKTVDRLVVVEELEPFMEEQLKQNGIACEGKSLFSLQGELSTGVVAQTLYALPAAPVSVQEVPARPPVLCAGCPHRAAYSVVKKMGLTVTGDIGCYTLGATPPLLAIDTCVCMGASISMAHGMGLAHPENAEKIIGVIGDSTFFHSGMTGLASAVYNNSRLTLLVLDNRTTGMTGHQGHPGTGQRLCGQPGQAIAIAPVCRALGAQLVIEVDPLDLTAFETAMKQATAFEGVSVVVAQSPCVLLTKEHPKPLNINDNCRACGICLKLGCPAISKGTGHMQLDATLCNGCTACRQVCRFDAID